MTHFTDWYFVATLLATQFIDNVVLLRINRDFAPAIKDTKPSHYRPIQLYSRGRLYLTIDKKGKVGSTEDGKNPDSILEMESYSVKHKRIRGRDGGSYLALTKDEKIRTRRKPKPDTLFIEQPTEDGFRFKYQNSESKYYLVIPYLRNKRKNNNVSRPAENRQNSAERTEFQQIGVEYLSPIQAGDLGRF